MGIFNTHLSETEIESLQIMNNTINKLIQWTYTESCP